VRKLIDKRHKQNRSIRDSYLILPETLTTKKGKALNEIMKLLRYEVKNA
jgi:hypothetical protein